MQNSPGGANSALGYAGFGSFHSDDVEVLIQHRPIPLPRVPNELTALGDDDLVRFVAGCNGRSLKQRCFSLDDTWCFLNHGAFGAVLSPLSRASNLWKEYQERQPLRFYDRVLFPHVCHALQMLADFLHVPDYESTDRGQHVLPCPNVTTAMNAVVSRHLTVPAREPALVIALSTAYGSTKKVLRYFCERSAGAMENGRYIYTEVAISFPLQSVEALQAQIMAGIKEAAKEHGLNGERIPIAFFSLDHISSNYGIVFPIAELCQWLRDDSAHNLDVQCLFVDGAHGPIALDVRLCEYDCDYYAGNLHKWFCSPKGAAFLYVNPRRATQHTTADAYIHPPVLSHGLGAGALSEWIWSGCADYSPWLVIPHGIQWWRSYGLDECRKYCRNLVHEAGEAIRTACGAQAEFLAPLDSAFAQGPMLLVPLSVAGVSSTEAKILQDHLHHCHAIEVPVKCLNGGQLYVRISAHAYNERDEYDRLAAVLCDVLKCDWADVAALTRRKMEMDECDGTA